jgi:hypothetical protein
VIAGVIAHVSRCGSTLAARAMALAPGTVALSEPPPVEDVLAGGGSAAERAPRLRTLLGELCGDAPRAVLKLDAWALHDLDVVRSALPGVPVALLVREPAEVLASHARLPGMHMIPGALDERRVRVTSEITTADDILDYRARVLAALLNRADAQRDAFALVCDYRDLVPDGLAAMARAFGLGALPAGPLAELLAGDAKAPGIPYDPAAHAGERPVTAAMRAAAARWADEPYRLLAA